MPRYVAFLRGVSPMNLKMPDLKRCLEDAGFTKVKTLLSSGNAVFDASSRSETAIARKVEAALAKQSGRAFQTIVRSTHYLQKLIDADFCTDLKLPANAKRVVTFLPEPCDAKVVLPPEKDGARILAVKGGEAFSAYVPHPGNPAFMVMIEKTLGKNVTTRTWDTVKKCASA